MKFWKRTPNNSENGTMHLNNLEYWYGKLFQNPNLETNYFLKNAHPFPPENMIHLQDIFFEEDTLFGSYGAFLQCKEPLSLKDPPPPPFNFILLLPLDVMCIPKNWESNVSYGGFSTTGKFRQFAGEVCTFMCNHCDIYLGVALTFCRATYEYF